MYYSSPPGLQFLHCLRNSVTGGSSLFVDSFLAATLLHISAPHRFQVLASTPVPFHYVNDNKHYYFSRPTIVPRGPWDKTTPPELDHINFAPPFQAPFEGSTTGTDRANWRRLVTAMTQFEEIIGRPEMRFEMTLKEGECVVFANRRVLHARREFDVTSGERWLKGTYVGWEDYLVGGTFWCDADGRVS
jgi:gamma-butyrobetaine dioxygenase